MNLRKDSSMDVYCRHHHDFSVQHSDLTDLIQQAVCIQHTCRSKCLMVWSSIGLSKMIKIFSPCVLGEIWKEVPIFPERCPCDWPQKSFFFLCVLGENFERCPDMRRKVEMNNAVRESELMTAHYLGCNCIKYIFHVLLEVLTSSILVCFSHF